MPWYGNLSNIPSGFKLCDGTNGTPDLRDRFIVGAGTSYALGNIGGEAFHTLSVAEMPSHKHSFTGDPTGGWNGIINGRAVLSDRTYSGYFGYTDYAGGDQPHENRPPYYALYYLIKQ